MHLDHVVEIDTCSEFLVHVLLSGPKLPVLGCLQVKLNQLLFESLENLILI